MVEAVIAEEDCKVTKPFIQQAARTMIKKLLLLSLFLLLLYLIFWPLPIQPVAWQAPLDIGYQGKFASNLSLAKIQRLDIAGTHGPEAIAVDSEGAIYASTHEGWIIRIDPKTQESERWVNTGGRPLGLAFANDGDLIVADAFLGLLSIAPHGQVTVLTNTIMGQAIQYADDVDVAPDGRIWFSDASSKFGALQSGGTYEASLLDLMEHGGHGRLLVHDPTTNTTTVALDGLQFANGVAVSAGGDYVLVNETGSYRVVRLWLEGERMGQSEIVIDNLPGFPDNIVRAPDGNFWIGLVAPRSKSLDQLADKPYVRKIVQRLPSFLRPSAAHYGHVFKMDGQGNVLVSLQDPLGGFHTNTGAVEHDGWLYVSSLHEDSLGRLRWPEP